MFSAGPPRGNESKVSVASEKRLEPQLALTTGPRFLPLLYSNWAEGVNVQAGSIVTSTVIQKHIKGTPEP